MKRRNFLQWSSGIAARLGSLLTPATLTNLWAPDAKGHGPSTKFSIARLIHGGEWNPRPNAARRLLVEISKSTSVEVRLEPQDLSPEDPRLFSFPFVWWTGTGEFPPLSLKAREQLNRFIRFGGFVLADNTQGAPGQGFDKSFRREIEEILPGATWSHLSNEHSIFRSFFLLTSEKALGRLASRPFIEGISLNDSTPLIYSMNDLGGALARDPFGNWEYDCIPGGEKQRSLALRFTVNTAMYALTGNYKKDQIHVREILRRRHR